MRKAVFFILFARLAQRGPVDGDGDIDGKTNFVRKQRGCFEVRPAVLFDTPPFSCWRLMLPRLRLGGGGGAEAEAREKFISKRAGAGKNRCVLGQLMASPPRP